MKILYLEDFEPDVQLVRQYMESLNHTIVAVSTIEEAWHYLQENHTDVFLVDIIIGNTLAYDLIDKVTAGNLATHIVAVTAKALPSERQRCLDLGCTWVIPKPFTIDDLEGVLLQLA